eukprot:1981754-Lingulodinium_polyedra.AAC.1
MEQAAEEMLGSMAAQAACENEAGTTWEKVLVEPVRQRAQGRILVPLCLLYTSDAADDMQCVDLG